MDNEAFFPLDENPDSGLHWRLLDWTIETPVMLYRNFFDRIAPTDQDISSLLADLYTLTAPLDDSDLDMELKKKVIDGVERVHNLDMMYRYASVSPWIGRGSVYHSMKARIEAGKGNKIGQIGHTAKGLGYKMMCLPEFAGLLGVACYAIAGGAVCTAIEAGVQTVKYVSKPDLAGRLKNAAQSASESFSRYMEERKKNREFSSKMEDRFYELVDDQI